MEYSDHVLWIKVSQTIRKAVVQLYGVIQLLLRLQLPRVLILFPFVH